MLATYQLRIGAPEETPPLCMQKISGSTPGRRAGKDLTGALKSCCLQSTLEYAELDGLATGTQLLSWAPEPATKSTGGTRSFRSAALMKTGGSRRLAQ